MGWLGRRRERQSIVRTDPPAWDGDRDRVRVLLEHPDRQVRERLTAELRDRGYAALACAGPAPADVSGVSCPLLTQDRCPAVSGADAIVTGLRVDSHVGRMVMLRAAKDDPDRPILVQAAETAGRPLPDGVATETFEGLEVDVLAATIDRLVSTRA